MVLVVLAFVGCSDEPEMAYTGGQNVIFCVRATWHNGLAGSKSSRALTATDILNPGMGEIKIGFDDYPAEIDVHCSNNTDFKLVKDGGAECNTHHDYWNYTTDAVYKDQEITRNELIFTATAVIDEDDDPDTPTDGDRLECRVTKDNLVNRHLQFTLQHTKALLRFAFKVSEKYDKVRQILVTGIKLNGKDCVIVKKVLNKNDMTYIAYAYIDPAVVKTTYENTIECTYSIYDREASFPIGEVSDANISDNSTHLTREDVKARNTFRLGKLKDAGGNTISKILAGYYYDLKVTLNPDFLYVLTDHDNEHITIQ